MDERLTGWVDDRWEEGWTDRQMNMWIGVQMSNQGNGDNALLIVKTFSCGYN